MSEPVNPVIENQDEDFSFKEVLQKRREDLFYLLTKKKELALALVIGVVIGCAISYFKPVTYTAKIKFVVDDSKEGGAGMMSALAGQFGLDIGSVGGAGGVLAGDNVQELLRSRKIIKRTLLTTNPYAKDSSTLADRYADVYKLKKKWKKYTGTKLISFPGNTDKYSRLQDSLLQDIIIRIEEGEVDVSKTDKKLTFFELNTTMRDEKLAQVFSLRLMQEATEFYIKTKTSRMRANVQRLQGRADSITRLLNRKTYSANAANSILIDINPAYTAANAGIEVQERDKFMLSSIYSEVLKNLEMSKTMLMQETPTFQIVDEPEFPLKKNRLGYLKGIVIGVFLSMFLISSVLLLRRKA